MKSKRITSIILMVVTMISVTMGQREIRIDAATNNVKEACAAALKTTGNTKKIGYKSSTPSDFDAISYQHNKKVSSMFFVTSDNTAYVICVAKAKTVGDADKLYKAFETYKYNKTHGTYFKTDFSKAEQAVLKNAIYGKQGKYVWYISMSSRKKNLAGEKALKKKLK